MIEGVLRKVIREHADAFAATIELFYHEPEKFVSYVPNANDHLTGKIIHPADGVTTTYITISQFCAVLEAHHGEKIAPVLLVEFGFGRLEETLGLRRVLHQGKVAFQLNTQLLKNTVEAGTIAAVSFGYRYFTDKLDASVAEICIKDGSGDLFTGSGVAVQGGGFLNITRLFTCKHNLYSQSGERHNIESITIAGEVYSAVNVFVLDRVDICVVVLDDYSGVKALPTTKAHLLEKVVSAGYPRVRLTEKSPLLCHRGEINGFMGTLEDGDRIILVSCEVAPGNSGGPLLNEYGAVIGIIHEKVETSSVEGMASYSCGIPMEQIYAEFEKQNYTQDYIGRSSSNAESRP
ncbi:serine protease [Lentibacter algarum]|uniref:S1 family peptidase n=1 Tax=Lentibacter algarum TaxID=576131 RepID=UPI001C0720B6|nr:serine protease [Lentibacter algarum]MBU2981382.1 serine protease [Lentibacter algarum]